MDNRSRHSYGSYNRSYYSGSQYTYVRRANQKKRKIKKHIIAIMMVVFLIAAAFSAFYMLGGLSLLSGSASDYNSDEMNLNTFIDSSKIKHTSYKDEKYETRYKTDDSYMINYPLTNIDAIDSTISDKIKYFEKCAAASDARFTSYDYITEIADNTYLSVVFRSTEYDSNKEKYGGDVFTMVFDLSSAKMLENGDVFKQNFYGFASEYVRDYFSNNADTKAQTSDKAFESATTPDKLHFEQFSLNAKQCTLYFSQKTLFGSGTEIYDITIPLSQISNYLKISLKGAKGASSKNPSIRDDIDPDKPMIALTFDDGPHYSNTEKILDVLKKYNGRATFFVVGKNASAYPDILKEISDAGCQIGNHTEDHSNLTELNDKKIKEEADLVDKAVKEATGSETTAFRPPYGAYNEKVQKILNKTPFIFWNVDTEDWRLLDSKKTSDSVISQAYDGAILLMHDIHDSTAEAAESFIPLLVKQGYQLVTVEELLYYKNINIEGGKTYPW